VSQQALLERLVAALERAGLPYMLTGSLVSSLQGEPRATYDVDLVIDVRPEDTPQLIAAVTAPDLYLDEQALADAVARRSVFNVIQTASGDKADFWPLTDDAFDRERFSRRRVVEALGLRLWVSAPEDTILIKLRWSMASGGSEKQFVDALRVYEVQAGGLDAQYLRDWAARLGVSGLLDELLRQAEPLDEQA
jgi:hypothetical protein